MWIRTQNKQRLVNADQLVDILVDKTGTKLYGVSILENRDFILLGEYKDRDTCLDILDVIMIVGSHEDVTFLQLPLGGDVSTWLEECQKLTEKIYNR